MRPPKCRYIDLDPCVTIFKPRGIPSTKLEEVELTLDELEAIRLADLLGLHHAEGGTRMGVSRATFGRILQKARHKVAGALLHGKMLRFNGGEVLTAREREYTCPSCGDPFMVPPFSVPPDRCPDCANGVGPT